jgi:NTE family protein
MQQNNENEVHRALVLQGGGALGAYEAGVFDVLYYWIKKDDNAVNNNKKNIFDIVAGTSIGAINAAIIVSHVIENSGRWEGCSQKLLDFWEYVSSSPDLINYWPFWPNWPFFWDEKLWMKIWDQRSKLDHDIATGEAARRYYSAKEFLTNGAPQFFSRPRQINDDRFLDDLLPFPGNIWYKYSNGPLKESIEKYIAKFPIATQGEQPRLLLITVDVMTGTTVTFDSYSRPKEDGKGDKEEEDEIRRYEYENLDNPDYDFEIDYSKGIMPEHILASASVPVNFDYTHVPIKYDYSSSFSTMRNYSDSACDKKTRCFWDGGLLSNSPLRELISEHQVFWRAKNKLESQEINSDTWKQFSQGNKFDIPNLQVYLVDLWPSKEKEIPNDHDRVKDRKNDITYQNKTDYDQKVAVIISDYIDLAEKIGNLALEVINSVNEKDKKDNLKKEFDRLIMKNGKSKHRNGNPRQYRDLIKGRFDLDTAFQLEREDDPHTISNKWFDFSTATVTKLIEDGRKQALRELLKREKNEKRNTEQLKLFIDVVETSRKNGEINQSHADGLTKLAKSIDE